MTGGLKWFRADPASLPPPEEEEASEAWDAEAPSSDSPSRRKDPSTHGQPLRLPSNLDRAYSAGSDAIVSGGKGGNVRKSLSVRWVAPKRVAAAGEEKPKATTWATMQRAMCPPPRHVWASFLVLAVLLTLGIIGSYYYVQGQATQAFGAATNVARVSARALERLLDEQMAPIYAIADFIKLNPHWPTVNASFDDLATAQSLRYHFYEIEVLPLGYIAAMYLPWLNLTGDALRQWKLDNFDYELNILQEAHRPSYWGPWIESAHLIMKNESIYLGSPWYGDGELAEGAFISRYSLFLHDDGTWEMPPETRNSTCPPEFCRLNDNRTFWGFVNCVFPWHTIMPGLSAVQNAGLRYKLVPNYRTSLPFFAASDVLPSSDSSSRVTVNVFNWLSWTLCVSQPGGWEPSWATGLYVGVTALALIMAAFTFFLLKGFEDQKRANAQLAEASRSLASESARSDALLYQMLPTFAAERLRQGIAVVARDYPDVSILFTDIVGFTEISARSSPRQIYAMLDDVFRTFDEIMMGFPFLYKVETIGDAYMVVANLQGSCAEHVDHLVEFALRIEEATKLLTAADGSTLRIRLGIHAGHVVGGIVGTNMPRFCLFGDTVNTSSRMESNSLPGKVHMSQAAYEKVVDKDKFEFEDRGEITVKGKGNMKTYFARWSSSQPPPPRRTTTSQPGSRASFQPVARPFSMNGPATRPPSTLVTLGPALSSPQASIALGPQDK